MKNRAFLSILTALLLTAFFSCCNTGKTTHLALEQEDSLTLFFDCEGKITTADHDYWDFDHPGTLSPKYNITTDGDINNIKIDNPTKWVTAKIEDGKLCLKCQDCDDIIPNRSLENDLI